MLVRRSSLWNHPSIRRGVEFVRRDQIVAARCSAPTKVANPRRPAIQRINHNARVHAAPQIVRRKALALHRQPHHKLPVDVDRGHQPLKRLLERGLQARECLRHCTAQLGVLGGRVGERGQGDGAAAGNGDASEVEREDGAQEKHLGAGAGEVGSAANGLVIDLTLVRDEVNGVCNRLLLQLLQLRFQRSVHNFLERAERGEWRIWLSGGVFF